MGRKVKLLIHYGVVLRINSRTDRFESLPAEEPGLRKLIFVG